MPISIYNITIDILMVEYLDIGLVFYFVSTLDEMIKLVSIIQSNVGNSRYTAIFRHDGKEKRVNFGDKRYENYTTHRDTERKKQYLLRHVKNEDWTNPMSSGALSRWILWNLPGFNASVKAYKRMFGV